MASHHSALDIDQPTAVGGQLNKHAINTAPSREIQSIAPTCLWMTEPQRPPPVDKSSSDTLASPARVKIMGRSPQMQRAMTHDLGPAGAGSASRCGLGQPVAGSG